ncbi:MAG: hypothetical protein GY906_00200 [bacterium]|nr:hypothetical protein [bacterium]
MAKYTAAFLVVFLLLASMAVEAQTQQDTVVLTVNGDPVYAADITFLLQNLAAQVAQATQRGGQEPDRDKMVQAAMAQAVNNRLLVQEALRVGLTSNQQAVATMLEEMTQAMGGKAKLEANLAAGGLSMQDLERTMRETDLVQQLVNTKLAPDLSVTEEEIKAFYDSRPDDFRTPAAVSARHILFRAEADTPEGELAGLRAQAEAARKRAIDGEDFATLAGELSQGPTASRGGDLGFFTKEQMVEPFASAAFALKPGEISPVVRTTFGFHVVKAEERRAEGVRSLAEVRDSISAYLLDGKVAPLLDELIKKLVEGADIVQVPPPGQAPAQQ